jgi:hypothetical protein
MVNKYPSKFVDIEFEPLKIPRRIFGLNDDTALDVDRGSEYMEDSYLGRCNDITKDRFIDSSRRRHGNYQSAYGTRTIGADEEAASVTEEYASRLSTRSGYLGNNEFNGYGPVDEQTKEMAKRFDETRYNATRRLGRHQFNGIANGFTDAREEVIRPRRGYASSFTGQQGSFSTKCAPIDVYDAPKVVPRKFNCSTGTEVQLPMCRRRKQGMPTVGNYTGW